MCGARLWVSRAVSLLGSGLISGEERRRPGASGAWGGRHPADAAAVAHVPLCPELAAQPLTPASRRRDSDVPPELEARSGLGAPAGANPAEPRAHAPGRSLADLRKPEDRGCWRDSLGGRGPRCSKAKRPCVGRGPGWLEPFCLAAGTQ